MDKLHQAAGVTIHKPEDPLLYVADDPGQVPLLTRPVDSCRTQCAASQHPGAIMQRGAVSFQHCHLSHGLGSGVVVRVKMEREVREAFVTVLYHLASEHHVEGAGVNQPGHSMFDAGLQDVLGALNIHRLDQVPVQLLPSRHAIGGDVEYTVHASDGPLNVGIFTYISLNKHNVLWHLLCWRDRVEQDDFGSFFTQRARQAAREIKYELLCRKLIKSLQF